MTAGRVRRKSSEFRGVGWHKGTMKWQATIWYDGKLHHVGLFERELDAALAYDEEARKIWGPDAVVNFPTSGPRRAPAPVVDPDQLANALLRALEEVIPNDPEARREAVKAAVRQLARDPGADRV